MIRAIVLFAVQGEAEVARLHGNVSTVEQVRAVSDNGRTGRWNTWVVVVAHLKLEGIIEVIRVLEDNSARPKW